MVFITVQHNVDMAGGFVQLIPSTARLTASDSSFLLLIEPVPSKSSFQWLYQSIAITSIFAISNFNCYVFENHFVIHFVNFILFVLQTPGIILKMKALELQIWNKHNRYTIIVSALICGQNWLSIMIHPNYTFKKAKLCNKFYSSLKIKNVYTSFI